MVCGGDLMCFRCLLAYLDACRRWMKCEYARGEKGKGEKRTRKEID